MRHYLITPTYNYIIVHSSRLTSFLCLRLAGAPYPQIDLGNRQTRSPISRVKIRNRKTAQGTFQVNSIDLKGLAESYLYLIQGEKEILTRIPHVYISMQISTGHCATKFIGVSRKNANHVRPILIYARASR